MEFIINKICKGIYQIDGAEPADVITITHMDGAEDKESGCFGKWVTAWMGDFNITRTYKEAKEIARYRFDGMKQ